jgi:hypothetical protein
LVWSDFGGRAERDEDEKTTAVREFMEESLALVVSPDDAQHAIVNNHVLYHICHKSVMRSPRLKALYATFSVYVLFVPYDEQLPTQFSIARHLLAKGLRYQEMGGTNNIARARSYFLRLPEAVRHHPNIQFAADFTIIDCSRAVLEKHCVAWWSLPQLYTLLTTEEFATQHSLRPCLQQTLKVLFDQAWKKHLPSNMFPKMDTMFEPEESTETSCTAWEPSAP